MNFITHVKLVNCFYFYGDWTGQRGHTGVFSCTEFTIWTFATVYVGGKKEERKHWICLKILLYFAKMLVWGHWLVRNVKMCVRFWMLMVFKVLKGNFQFEKWISLQNTNSYIFFYSIKEDVMLSSNYFHKLVPLVIITIIFSSPTSQNIIV